VVDAVDHAGAAHDAFVFKAEALVQRLRIQVVRANRELDARESARTRPVDRRLQSRCTGADDLQMCREPSSAGLPLAQGAKTAKGRDKLPL
jgi:hypothetical protein